MLELIGNASCRLQQLTGVKVLEIVTKDIIVSEDPSLYCTESR